MVDTEVMWSLIVILVIGCILFSWIAVDLTKRVERLERSDYMRERANHQTSSDYSALVKADTDLTLDC